MKFISMKTCITLLLLVSAATLHCQATIRTVSNDPQNPAQFTTIQAAVDAAVAGDTIYVSGSPNTYGAVSVNKRLVLIGAGYNPANFLTPPTSIVSAGFTLSGSASGTVISGFRLCGITGGGGIDNIQIFRNFLGNGCNGVVLNINGSNWAISNNIFNFGSIQINNSSTIIIQNNIFSNGGVSLSNQSSVIIDHNLFFGTNSNRSLSNVKNALVSNNIFARTVDPTIDAATQFNLFRNNLNLLANVGDTAPTNSFAGGPNSESGNFVGVDPLFVNAPDFNGYNALYNYRLQSTSPGKNAGNDGTDLGIYGGGFVFPSAGAPGSGFDTSASPPVPQVTNVNIQNTSLAPGAQLRVTIQATVNN